MEKRNLQVIHKGSAIGICLIISIILVATSVPFLEDKTVAYILLGTQVSGFLIFLLLFIPKGQRLEFTKYGVQFYSFGPHQVRTYFWNQMKDVVVQDTNDGKITKKKVVIQLHRPESEHSGPASDNYIERVIDAEVYGYEPEQLKEIIKKKIHQKAV